jgi:hypothetical protein
LREEAHDDKKREKEREFLRIQMCG